MPEVVETRLEIGWLVPNSTAVIPTMAIAKAAALASPTLTHIIGAMGFLAGLVGCSMASDGALAATFSTSRRAPTRALGIFFIATVAAELSVRA